MDLREQTGFINAFILVLFVSTFVFGLMIGDAWKIITPIIWVSAFLLSLTILLCAYGVNMVVQND
jgi:hypothetical protein